MKDDSMHDLTARQKNKEEGKLRARELAIQKQSQSSAFNVEERTSTRHGARNQHRHKHFAKWILSTFPHVLDECVDNNDDNDDLNAPTRHILDVAGGKGELSARLCLCHSLRVTMVDPRQADIASVYMKDVVPKLPNKWQSSIQKRLEICPKFVEGLLEKRYEQLVMPFDAPANIRNEMDDSQQMDWVLSNMSPALHEAVKNASLIIGLHADGATEAIVDAALYYNKPFVVVPCCVFPNLFSNRFIIVQDAGGTSAPKQIPVRTHDQFCEYLMKKDVRFKREVLPFEGRNVAIWWDGKA
jgi:hypothetical protein